MANFLFSFAPYSAALVQFLRSNLGIGYTILFNGIGFVAIFLQLMSFQMSNRKLLIAVSIAGNTGWMLYFLLQGDFVSGLGNFVRILQKIVFIFREKHAWAKSKWWLIVFLALSVTFSTLTFKTWRDIFPFTTSILAAVAFFMIDENLIRKISISVYVLSICNSVSKLYWIALIADVTALISIIVALVRYQKHKRPKTHEPQQTPNAEQIKQPIK